MRTRVVWMSIVLALSLQACGGTSGDPPPGVSASTPTTVEKRPEGRKAKKRTPAERRAERRALAAERRSCPAMGIVEPGEKEGACTLNGTWYVVANGKSKLRLKLLHAAIRGISVAQEVPQGRGKPRARPQGAFMLISLMVENRDDVAHRFGAGQAVLAIGNQQYHDVGRVERGFPDALAYAGRGAIPPGGVARGEVVFDVVPEDLRRIGTGGRLFISNFTNLNRGVGSTGEVGYLRLYV